MNIIARRMTMAQIAITGYVAGAFDRMRKDDRGQGSLEYVGIVVAVLAVLALVIAALKGVDIAGKLTAAINSIFG